MSEQNKAVVRRYVEGLNQENLAVFDKILAQEFANQSPRLGIVNREKTVNDYPLFFRAFPDCHRTIEDVIAEGDKVFLRTTVQGTHQESVTGVSIEPTGENVTCNSWEMFRFNNGRIVEGWTMHDFKDQVEAAAREQGADNHFGKASGKKGKPSPLQVKINGQATTASVILDGDGSPIGLDITADCEVRNLEPDNAKSDQKCHVIVIDNDEPGKDNDNFLMEITSVGYTSNIVVNGDVLSKGNIQAHP